MKSFAVATMLVITLGATPTPAPLSCEQQLQRDVAVMRNLDARAKLANEQVKKALDADARVLARYKQTAETAVAMSTRATANATRFEQLAFQASSNAERALTAATYWKKRAQALETENAQLRHAHAEPSAEPR